MNVRERERMIVSECVCAYVCDVYVCAITITTVATRHA